MAQRVNARLRFIKIEKPGSNIDLIKDAVKKPEAPKDTSEEKDGSEKEDLRE